MNERPETHYAWNGDVALAYQVFGEGDPDLLYLQGWLSNVELNWDHPMMSRFLRGLARTRRLIMTDPRGQGCSERSSPHDVWPLETMMEDVAIVLEAAGSERAALLASDQLGFVACMFAATYPERNGRSDPVPRCGELPVVDGDPVGVDRRTVRAAMRGVQEPDNASGLPRGRSQARPLGR